MLSEFSFDLHLFIGRVAVIESDMADKNTRRREIAEGTKDERIKYVAAREDEPTATSRVSYYRPIRWKSASDSFNNTSARVPSFHVTFPPLSNQETSY